MMWMPAVWMILVHMPWPIPLAVLQAEYDGRGWRVQWDSLYVKRDV